jgi:hypothetical protein
VLFLASVYSWRNIDLLLGIGRTSAAKTYICVVYAFKTTDERLDFLKLVGIFVNQLCAVCCH